MSNTLASPSFSQHLETSEDNQFQEIADKLFEGKRMSREDGLFLFTYPDEERLCELADWVRIQKAGQEVHYTSTYYVHPTNLCELSCPMCSFYAKPGWDKAWFYSPSALVKKIEKALPLGLNEIHIVGGLWRDCDLYYYQELFAGIKQLDEKLHIKALTAVEYHFLAELHGISIPKVFEKMQDWGLGSLPGGGAEVLVESIRKQVAPQKISSDEFLEIHEMAHNTGLPSNITMLFGHVEEEKDLITHLEKVRSLQDKTQGFRSFVPLKFHTDNNALGKRSKRLKSKSAKRIYAISRLMLDNIPNIKVLWNYLGIDEAKDLLFCGGNDLASTATEEKIILMAGGIEVKMSKENMEMMIKELGRTPKFSHSAQV